MSVYILAFLAAFLLADVLAVRLALARGMAFLAGGIFGRGTPRSYLAANGAMISIIAGLVGVLFLRTTLLFLGPSGVLVNTLNLVVNLRHALLAILAVNPALFTLMVFSLLKAALLYLLPEIMLLALIGATGGLLRGGLNSRNQSASR